MPWFYLGDSNHPVCANALLLTNFIKNLLTQELVRNARLSFHCIKNMLICCSLCMHIICPLIFVLNSISTQELIKPIGVQLDWTSNTSRQKINFLTNQRGYDKSETTIRKLSTRRIQICLVYFSLIIF